MLSFELINVDELEADTSPHVPASAPSESPGASTVADRIAGTLAGRIHARGLAGSGPDGRWDRNAPATVEKKGFDAPNIETGEMLSVPHVKGVVSASDSEMSMTYGLGTVDDKGVSDRDRAWYAETGQSAQKIKRPFYALNERDADLVAEIAGDEWDARAAGQAGRRGLPGASGPLALGGP